MQTMLYMLSEQKHRQIMSYVLRTREGKLVVIDGGNTAEAENLQEKLIELGGAEPVVDLWLLTHPHDDHIHALLEIFSKPNPLKVKAIYSRFLPYEFYKEHDFAGSDNARFTMEFNRFRDAHPDICHSFEQGQHLYAGSAEFTVLRVPDERFCMNVINNSSVVFRLDVEGQRILFVGDLGEEAGDDVLDRVPREELQADFVQMAHHGQSGVKKSFYEAVQPKACLWNTPDWLWNNDRGGGYNTGPWKTVETREWVKELGIPHHFVTKDGEQAIPLPYPL